MREKGREHGKFPSEYLLIAPQHLIPNRGRKINKIELAKESLEVSLQDERRQNPKNSLRKIRQGIPLLKWGEGGKYSIGQ